LRCRNAIAGCQRIHVKDYAGNAGYTAAGAGIRTLVTCAVTVPPALPCVTTGTIAWELEYPSRWAASTRPNSRLAENHSCSTCRTAAAASDPDANPVVLSKARAGPAEDVLSMPPAIIGILVHIMYVA
jgi:hypothetical protein